MAKTVIDLKVKVDDENRFTIDIVSNYPIHQVRLLINELIDTIELEQEENNSNL